jgi:hypothetical protein
MGTYYKIFQIQQNPQDAQCPFACIMGEGHVGNEHFRDLLKCMVEGGCMEQVNFLN